MNLAEYIDHTQLKPQATLHDIRALCRQALRHGFAAVCVNPCHVELAAKLLKDSGVKVGTVVGFPLGINTTAVKAFETALAVEQGAEEIDMVANIGAMKTGMWNDVFEDIKAVVAAAQGRTVKVIVETTLLNDLEKEKICELVMVSGADYIKTSTGFAGGGATAEDIALFKGIAGGRIGIKASGGIKSREEAEEMLAAGATRLGTSAGLAIIGADKVPEDFT